MRFSRATKELSVGAVVSLGMILFAIAVMAITKESRLFVPKVKYWTRFENTSGLAQGSPVRLIGVQIGTVDEIEFPEDIRETRIKVGFSIDRTYANRIRAKSQAFLKSLTYLSQDKYVELTPGNPDAPALAPGGFIEPGVSAWETTLQQSQSIADDVKEITASLKDLLVALNRGGGIVHEMIHNPDFGREGVANFEASLAAMRRTLEGVQTGKGLAGRLLTNETFGRKQAENLDVALSHMRSVLEKIDADQGLIAQLNAPDGKGSQIIEDLTAGSAALRSAAEGVKAGKGLLGRLVSDDGYAESLLKTIEGAAGHADSILKKIDAGEGTIGGIVNDPSVYEGLKDVVAGIEKSRLGKGVVRHYGKKGAKRRAEDSGKTEGQDDTKEKPATPPADQPNP